MEDNNNKKSSVGIPAAIYTSMFQNHPDGQKILEELASMFYDRTSISNPVDPNVTLVMEGQRQVVLFILKKCADGQK